MSHVASMHTAMIALFLSLLLVGFVFTSKAKSVGLVAPSSRFDRAVGHDVSPFQRHAALYMH